MTAGIFYVFAGLTIFSALMVIFKKNPVSSAFALVLTLFGVAGIFAILGAHLLAALQLLVYAGAVMVLFVFVIMLLSADVPSFDLARTNGVGRAVVIGLALILGVLLTQVFQSTNFPQGNMAISPQGIEQAGNTKAISSLLFTEYLFPFELTSILLLAGIVGVVAIAMRKSKLEQEN